MLLRLFLFFLNVSISAVVIANDVPKLRMLSEENPPFNFSKDGNRQGIAVELLEEMLRQIGSKQKLSEIEMLSWEHAYNLVQEKSNTVLFATTRTKGRENLFKWVCPIATDKTELVALKSSAIKVNSKTDLHKYKIGAVRNSAGEQLLLALGIRSENLEYTTYASFLTQLTNKKVDLVAFNLAAIQRTAQNAGIKADNYDSIYLLSESNLCYAFNKQTSSTLIDKLQNVMNEIITSGRHKNITAKYIH